MISIDRLSITAQDIFTPFNIEIFKQLALSVLLGALIGIERKLAKKRAGMRTFAFVALGSTLFTAVSINALKFISMQAGGVSFDPTRVAAQIVSGVGFIGAGVIFFSGSKLRGVTTAAGLWLAAAIGMAVGFGFYSIAIFTTTLALLILELFWFVEKKITKKISWYRSPDGEDE